MKKGLTCAVAFFFQYKLALGSGFWPEDETDPAKLRKYCEDRKGRFVENDLGNGEKFYECIFKDRTSCTANDGDWVSIQRPDGSLGFECIIEYEYVEDGEWEPPEYEIGENALTVGDSLVVPVPGVVWCESDDAMVLVTHGYDVNCQESPNKPADCLPAPTQASLKAGDAKLYPSGRRFDLVRKGVFVARMRCTGQGKAPSVETVVSFNVVGESEANQEQFLPSADSGLIFIRPKVLFDVVDLTMFDALLFASAVTEAINDILDIGMTIDQVRVLQVMPEGVQYELRVAEADLPIVGGLVNNELFAYPLSEYLYEYGFLNTNSSCSAHEFVDVDTESYMALSPMAKTSLALILGITGGCFFLLGMCGVRMYFKQRKLVAKEKNLQHEKTLVDNRARGLDAKEDELSKREKEIAEKLQQIQQQEQELLDEKAKLAKEQEELEKEAEEAEAKVEEVEIEELKAVDPEGAAALEDQAGQLEEELLQESKSRLEQLKERFKGVVPPASLEKIKTNLDLGSLAFLFRPPRQTSMQNEADSDIDRVKAFSTKIATKEDQEEFLLLVEQLVQKGSLRDLPMDENERLKKEYEDAMFQMQNELYQKRQQYTAKIAERRRRRLDLVMADANNQEATTNDVPAEDAEPAGEDSVKATDSAAAHVTVKEELVKEIEQELAEQFERDLARVKAESPSKEAYESALATLEAKREEKKQRQLEAIAKRREIVRKRAKENEKKLAEERAAAEKKRLEIAQKVSSVFKKISSVENRVQKLKDEHSKAQAMLQDQVKNERDRQRQKLQDRKNKRSAKVTPAVEST